MFTKINKFASAVLLLTAFSAIANVDLSTLDIQSQDQSLDFKNKVHQYQGNVRLHYQDLAITADLLVVDASAGVGNEVVTAKGKPAIFKKGSTEQDTVTAQASTVVFYVNKKLITLAGAAQLSQAGSMVSGDEMSYDIVTQKLNAGSKEGSQNRTQTVIQQQKPAQP